MVYMVQCTMITFIWTVDWISPKEEKGYQCDSIDSGFGADTINIYLDDQEGNLGAHLINLGNGNDVNSIALL